MQPFICRYFVCNDEDNVFLLSTLTGKMPKDPNCEEFEKHISTHFNTLKTVADARRSEIGTCSDWSVLQIILSNMYDENGEKFYYINLWAGPRNPIPSVDSSKWLLASEPSGHMHSLAAPSYCYELSFETSMFFTSWHNIFIRLVNFYAQTCRSEEHASFLSRANYLRFFIHQDLSNHGGQPLKPYAFAYQRARSLMLPQHAQIVKNCPVDKLVCDVSLMENGHFVLIPHSEFQAQKITLANCEFID